MGKKWLEERTDFAFGDQSIDQILFLDLADVWQLFVLSYPNQTPAIGVLRETVGSVQLES